MSALMFISGSVLQNFTSHFSVVWYMDHLQISLHWRRVTSLLPVIMWILTWIQVQPDLNFVFVLCCAQAFSFLYKS